MRSILHTRKPSRFAWGGSLDHEAAKLAKRAKREGRGGWLPPGIRRPFAARQRHRGTRFASFALRDLRQLRGFVVQTRTDARTLTTLGANRTRNKPPSERKRMFGAEQIQVAWEALAQRGWLSVR